MAKFAKFGVKIPKQHPVGKNSRSAMLPSRSALKALTSGSPDQRSTLQFARRTPIGAGGPSTYQDIMNMAENGIDPLKRG